MIDLKSLLNIAILKAEKRIIIYTIAIILGLGWTIRTLWVDFGSIYKELYKECTEKQNTCEEQRRKFELENMRLMIENTRLLRFEKDSLNKLTKLNNRIIKTQ